MDANLVQSNFLGGQWSAHAQGRFDDPRYKTALSTCLNALPMEEGACPRRSGTRFVSTTRGGAVGRVIPFAFEASAPFAMSLTDSHMQFVNGTKMLTRSDGAIVSSISTANPAILTVTTTTGWTNTDQLVFLYQNAITANALPLLANRVFSIVKQTSSQFALFDSVTGASIDGSTIGWSSGLSLNVGPLEDLATPWVQAELAAVRSVQTETETFLLHGSHAPQLLTANTAVNPIAFALNPASFEDGPYLDAVNNGGTITPNGLTGSVALQFSSISQVNGGAGFSSADIGRHIRMFSIQIAWTDANYGAGDQRSDGGVSYLCIADVSSGSPSPSRNPGHWVLSPSSSQWAWAAIVAVSNSSLVTVQFAADAVQPTGVGAANGLLTLQPMSLWRLGLFSPGAGYPKCGCYHEGRLWLSGTVKNRIDSSMSNKLLTFSPTSLNGAVADNNAISYTFNDREVNDIYWMTSGLQGISCGTLGGEWLLQTGSGNTPMTPTNIQAHPVTRYGCANIEPRHTGLTVVFVQKFKRKLLEYLSDIFSGKFFGPNLAAYTKGITKAGIAELAYQDEIAPVVWMRMNDGSLAGATYRRTSAYSTAPPDFNGWHTHVLGSGRVIESICVGPSVDGILQNLTMVTNDPDANVRHIEILSDIFDEGSALLDAWFVDDGIVPSAAQTVNHSNYNYVRLQGLWALNGDTVTAFIGGLDCGDFTVANGFIDVPYANQGAFVFRDGVQASQNSAFTAAYLASLNGGDGTVHLDGTAGTFQAAVGFTYTTQGQLLRTIDPRDAGARTGPALGKTRRTHMYAALIENSIQGAVKFGTSFSNMRLANFQTSGRSGPYPTNTLYAGLHWDTLEDGYTFDSQLCWQVTRPYPTTILALGPFHETQDR